ncbi:hypothetical protein HZH66_009619 [Vespula vulgaris]|uniref:Uncharacterized protein n=1 Tax=Vespula vulgaris TaxID=7454 RepID=A0A834JQP0_VESVU|nr:hypothetical protein HZH66_009619 [Vespula vulgaris]
MISARASQRRIDPREAASVDRHPVSEVVDPSLEDRPLFSQESKAVTMGICAQYIQEKKKQQREIFKSICHNKSWRIYLVDLPRAWCPLRRVVPWYSCVGQRFAARAAGDHAHDRVRHTPKRTHRKLPKRLPALRPDTSLR